MVKRFDKVKIKSPTDCNNNKIGVLISISTVSQYPYSVCFGVDRSGNGNIGIYLKHELEVIK